LLDKGLRWGNPLPLGELEPSAGTSLTVFFTLFDPGISGKKPLLLQPLSQLLVIFYQGSGDAVPYGTSLPRDTPSFDIYIDVELLLGVGYYKGSFYHYPMGFVGEMEEEIPLVDHYLPSTGTEVNPGYGGFPSAGAVILDKNQFSPSKILN